MKIINQPFEKTIEIATGMSKSRSALLGLYEFCRNGKKPYYIVGFRNLMIQDFKIRSGDLLKFLGIIDPEKGFIEDEIKLLKAWKSE